MLSRDRSELHERINRRSEDLFNNGLVDEVSQLLSDYGSFSKTSLQGVGYEEALNHLHGNCELQEAIEETKIRTRRYARRQETWFRGLSECHWLPVYSTTQVEQIIEMICSQAS